MTDTLVNVDSAVCSAPSNSHDATYDASSASATRKAMACNKKN